MKFLARILGEERFFRLWLGYQDWKRNRIIKTYRREIEAAIAAARAKHGLQTVVTSHGAEAFAYRQQDVIHWGLNRAKDGLNVLRGIRTPEGRDVGVT